MKSFSLILSIPSLLCVVNSKAAAQSFEAGIIQVPDNCVGLESPCVIRNRGKSYQYSWGEIKFHNPADTIVKIVKENDHLNIEILKGALWIQENESDLISVAVNGVLIDATSAMVSKDSEFVKVLDLEKFTLSKYKIEKGAVPERHLASFASKVELIQMTKSFFDDLPAMKAFLAKQEGRWQEEFEKQRESQSKVLKRAIASEEKKIEEEVSRQLKEKKERARARQELFYRTFLR